MPFTKAGRELQPFVQCGERHHSFSPLLFENESDPATGNETTVNGKHFGTVSVPSWSRNYKVWEPDCQQVRIAC